jgi:hypothetical protein
MTSIATDLASLLGSILEKEKRVRELRDVQNDSSDSAMEIQELLSR